MGKTLRKALSAQRATVSGCLGLLLSGALVLLATLGLALVLPALSGPKLPPLLDQLLVELGAFGLWGLILGLAVPISALIYKYWETQVESRRESLRREYTSHIAPPLTLTEARTLSAHYATLLTEQLEELLTDSYELRPGAIDLIREELARRHTDQLK